MDLEGIVGKLSSVHSDALEVVRRVLEARAEGAAGRLSELELRSEVHRTYRLLAELLAAVEAEREQGARP